MDRALRHDPAFGARGPGQQLSKRKDDRPSWFSERRAFDGEVRAIACGAEGVVRLHDHVLATEQRTDSGDVDLTPDAQVHVTLGGSATNHELARDAPKVRLS